MSQPDKLQEQKVFARRKWSAEQLHIPLQASRKVGREQWLKKLEADDFLPDETHWPCWQVLNSAETAATAHLQHPYWASSFDHATGQAIEAYAERFFTLDPAERRQQYARLFAASFDNPRLQARLASLAPGLDLPVAADPPQPDEEDAELVLGDVEELARHLRSLFVLAPAARARLHLSFLREQATEMPRWAGAAKQINESQPELAALLPEICAELIAGDGLRQDAANVQEQRDTHRLLHELQAELKVTSSRSSFFDGWVANRYTAFIAVLLLVRLLASLGGTNSSPRAPSYPPLPVAEHQAKLEQILAQTRAQLEQHKQDAVDRKWIEMEPEEFAALGGPEEVQRLGLEKKRADYWKWHARYERFSAALEAKQAELPDLQRRLYDAQRKERVAETNYKAALKVIELSKSNPADASRSAERWLQDRQQIRAEVAQLIEEQEQLLNEILRLKIQCTAILTTLPSKQSPDDAP